MCLPLSMYKNTDSESNVTDGMMEKIKVQSTPEFTF